MAPPKRNVSNKKLKEKDYVGLYDGSKKKWMTRKVTDKDGDMKVGMAPVKSKPSEALSYNKGYSNKSAKEPARNPRGTATKAKKK